MKERNKENKLTDNIINSGWVKIPIGNIIIFEYGKGLISTKRNRIGNVPVFGSNGIVGFHSSALVNNPCLIIGRKGAAGAVHISNVPCWPIDTTYYVIPPTGINLIFLFYFLSELNLNCLDKSTAIPGLNRNDVYSISIPIPPINEQNRIVEKIEELFTKLDAGVAALEKVRAQLKRYRQAVLKAAFSGQLTSEWRKKYSNVGAGSSRPKESHILDAQGGATTTPFGGPLQNNNMPDLPAGWEWKNGKNIFDFITSGSRGWAKYYSDTGPIFLRMGNLDHNSISLDLRNIQHVLLPKGIEGIRTKVEANDILISITADVGMIALIPENFDEAYINQHIALCRPKKEVFQKYVAWYLVCQEGGLKQFQNMRRGATKIGLGLDDIRMINIPLTEKEEQNQIVSEIECRFSVADEVGKTVDNALKQAKRLRQSILKMAFEGKLVPQDPKDEPAEKLLERIRIEKQKLAKKGKK